MSDLKRVTTQSQLDEALADGVVDLIVDAPNGDWLEIRHDGLVRVWESSHVEAWESSHVEARESSHVVARGSSHVVAGRWTAVHLWSQRVTLTGDGHIIDMTAVDLTDVDLWREFTGARIDPGADELIVGHVSSQGHEGRMGRDGTIRIGCWQGTADGLRKLAAGKDWPSLADSEQRDRFRPRLLAFADLCDEQAKAWGAQA